MSLFKHHPHPHTPVNVNEQQASEQTGLNQRVAVLITKSFGSMPAAYFLIAWMAVWMVLANASFWLFSLDKYPYPFLLFCSNIVQLVALPILAVGQNTLSRKAELQAEEQFNTTKKTFEDILQIMQHLDTQDAEILKHTTMLEKLLQSRKDLSS